MTRERFPTKVADRLLASMIGPFTPMIQLEMIFGDSLDEQRLADALELTMAAEPILGCRFVPDNFMPFWEGLPQNRYDNFTFTRDGEAYEAFRNKGIDVHSGPQLRVCLYRTHTCDRLLVKVSHLVCDAAGVKEVAGMLSGGYTRLGKNPGFRPEPNTGDHRSVRQVFEHIPWYAHPKIFLNYLGEQTAAALPNKTHGLSIRGGPNGIGRYVVRHIDRETFSRVTDYAKGHGATINDMVLTSVFRAVSAMEERDPKAALRLATTIDLRRYIPGMKAKALTNLSSIELFTYGRDMEADFELTLARVAEKMNRRKASWLGLNPFNSMMLVFTVLPFSLFRQMTAKGWEVKANSANAFDMMTNMGDIPVENVSFDKEPDAAWLLPPACHLPILFFGCSGYAGGLTFSAGVGPDDGDRDTVEVFFDLVAGELAGDGFIG